MVEKEGDAKKYRRPYCGFWKALRRTRCLDMKMTPEEFKLVRNYNRKLNADSLRKDIIHKAMTLGLYTRGVNDDNPQQDLYEAFLSILRMNDNDVHKARQYKTKKLRQLNRNELAEVFESQELHPFRILDEATGTLYGYDNIDFLNMQGGNENDNSPGI